MIKKYYSQFIYKLYIENLLNNISIFLIIAKNLAL